ncbi:MAG: hypothetical protein DYG93_05800 [Leptolyngbya sp. PLA2]|nr:hypothetical protein [Leptolyngbya sp.]MCE7971163.1 hypothetical protein [Leptolyngbya sp. PL-A2]MCQ3940842.1 hypothetical protein [cyanobacterium CYA1]MCZ7634136.1 hypothetical protein [Phycisphaerales bacterium]MDL1905157.1 hypothetical protein [Synechococcales cyanobacterium CNB]GIK19294.1 MAG: ferredoxin--NADP(+) reductase [Planctomycetota bacterium]
MSHEAPIRIPGPALPEVRMHLHTPADPGVGVVVETRVCTARKAAGFVRHVAIDVGRTKLAGNFRVGQSFGVIPPGLDAHGKPHKVRLYSIACPTAGEDGRGQVLSTTVKRTIDEHWETHRLFLGVASNWLCDLREGDEVPVTGPSGKRFLLPADPAAHDYLFFATGTGIAPFRGMILELLAAAVPSRIVLVMGVAYQTDLIYDAELDALAASSGGRFTYLRTLSRQPQIDGGPPMYVQDRLRTHADLLGPLLASERTLVYVCGIAGMELGIFQSMAGTLPPSTLEGYLRVEPDAGEPGAWTRRMIHRQVSPTRRVFMEVY